MKCGNCGVNYDDEDKECPICGTKAGHGTHIAVPRYTTYSHGTHNPKDCTHETYTSEKDFTGRTASRSSAVMNGSPARKAQPQANKSGSMIVVIIIVILLAIGPMLLNIVSRVISDIGMNGYGGYNTSSSNGAFQIPNGAGLDASAESSMLDATLLRGSKWAVDMPDGSKVDLAVDNEDRYTMTWTRAKGDTYTETGGAYMWYEVDEIYFTDDFPVGQYEAYTLNLERDGIEAYSGALPVSLTPERERNIFMTMYLEAGAPGDTYVILDDMAEGAPIFPEEPVKIVQVVAG